MENDPNPYEGMPEDELLVAARQIEAGFLRFIDSCSDEPQFEELMLVTEASRVAKNRSDLALRARKFTKDKVRNSRALAIHVNPDPPPITPPPITVPA